MTQFKIAFFLHENEVNSFSTKVFTKRTSQCQIYCSRFFDNFGKKISTVSDIKIVNELLEYTKRSHKQRSAGTIVYYDILAYNNNDYSLIEKIVNEYS